LIESLVMADVQMDSVDNFPADFEQVEKGMARVRFSDDAIADTYIESYDAPEESQMVLDDHNDVSIPKLTVASSESDVSSMVLEESHSSPSFLKSATVSAVSDFSESPDVPPSRPDPMLTHAKSSPEILETSGLKAEMEKVLATHMDVTHVLDRLYLSDYVSLSAERLAELGVSLVINATYEIPNVEVCDGSVEFIQLHINDSITADMSQHMDRCADRIHEVRSAGGVALVHCALGISRSVTICLAYLVKHEGRTLREAYFELKKKRPIIRPNEGTLFVHLPCLFAYTFCSLLTYNIFILNSLLFICIS